MLSTRPVGRGGRLLILRFRRWHLDRILEIERASFGREAYPRRLFLELKQDCGDLFFVAKSGRRIAGYIVSCAEAGEAEIVSIAVGPEFRRRGIGARLMRHTLAALKRAGVRRVGLMVRSSDAATVRFYRSFGFRAARKVARYYSNDGDALRMVLIR